jgi:peptide deformylase
LLPARVVALLVAPAEGKAYPAGVAVRKILQLGDPSLHQRAGEVVDVGSVAGTIRDLADTLAAFRAERGFGRGIAAPQIGAVERVLFVNVPSGFVGALVNPSIAAASAERFELWDDCFSFPQLMVRVSRAVNCRVRYQDEQGTVKHVDASGDLSELLQHEIDHLDGILATERAVSPTSLCTREEWERRYRRP